MSDYGRLLEENTALRAETERLLKRVKELMDKSVEPAPPAPEEKPPESA